MYTHGCTLSLFAVPRRRLRVRRSPVLDSHVPCDSVPFWGLALLLRSLVCVRRLMSRGRWCNPTEAGEGEVMLLKELMVG